MDQPTTDPTSPGGELRRNPVSGKLSIVAPGRAARPHDGRAPGAAPACPFCAGNEALTPPEVEARRPAGGAPDSPGWTLRVVPNKYPALTGMHEVIVHSPDHRAELEDLSADDLTATVACYQRRIGAQLDAGAVAATLVVNRGVGSGASLEHPHAQLFATPVLPPLLQDELMEFDRHRNRYGTCVLCDEIAGAGERLVFASDHVAWTPLASRFSHELWLAPAEHVADVRDADPAALGAALRRALVAVRTATAGAPCNLWIHTVPADPRGTFHWHVEIAPRLSGIAGFELGSDIADRQRRPGRRRGGLARRRAGLSAGRRARARRRPVRRDARRMAQRLPASAVQSAPRRRRNDRRQRSDSDGPPPIEAWISTGDHLAPSSCACVPAPRCERGSCGRAARPGGRARRLRRRLGARARHSHADPGPVGEPR